ncbi:hypothetical protein N2152v2_007149 [Parachlorella kessleri]
MEPELTESGEVKVEESFLNVAAQAAIVEAPQDNDVDALAVRLDAHSRSLRADLLDFVLQLKERQLQQRCQAVDHQRAEGEALKQEHEEGIRAAEQRLYLEANAANETLSQRLAELEEELAGERKTRAKLEEDMKRAFMRGVCALNIEAMAIMKNGGAPGAENASFNQALPHATGLFGEEAAASSQWMIGSLAAAHQQQVAEAATVPAAPCQWPWQQHAAYAEPGVPAAYSPHSPKLPAARLGHHLPTSQEAGPAGLAVLPKPAIQVPHPLVKVAPVHPVELVKTSVDGPLAVRSPKVRAHHPVAIPSSLPTNVPDHIAAAMLRRPQTAVAAANESRAKAATDPRRPATSAVASKSSNAVSQRSLAARRPSGPVVIRGQAAGMQTAAQEAAALRRSSTSPIKGVGR